MSFADLDKALQDKMIKLAMAGKAQTPGNQSKARQMLNSEPGFFASIKRRATGEKETQVDNATIDHFKGSEAETDGPATKTGDVKAGGSSPGKGSTAGAKPAQTKSAPSANSGSGKPGESKMAQADAAAQRGGSGSPVAPGSSVAAAGAGTDMSGVVKAGAAIAGAVGLYHGVKYLLGKNGEPVAPAPPDAVVTVDSNTGAPIGPQGSAADAIPAGGNIPPGAMDAAAAAANSRGGLPAVQGSPQDAIAEAAINGGLPAVQNASPVVQQMPDQQGQIGQSPRSMPADVPIDADVGGAPQVGGPGPQAQIPGGSEQDALEAMLDRASTGNRVMTGELSRLATPPGIPQMKPHLQLRPPPRL